MATNDESVERRRIRIAVIFVFNIYFIFSHLYVKWSSTDRFIFLFFGSSKCYIWLRQKLHHIIARSVDGRKCTSCVLPHITRASQYNRQLISCFIIPCVEFTAKLSGQLTVYFPFQNDPIMWLLAEHLVASHHIDRLLFILYRAIYLYRHQRVRSCMDWSMRGHWPLVNILAMFTCTSNGSCSVQRFVVPFQTIDRRKYRDSLPAVPLRRNRSAASSLSFVIAVIISKESPQNEKHIGNTTTTTNDTQKTETRERERENKTVALYWPFKSKNTCICICRCARPGPLCSAH